MASLLVSEPFSAADAEKPKQFVETRIDFLLGLGAEPAEYTPKEKAFLRKLDGFFDAHGLRPISKRMAHTYVKMMANDVDGTFDRVQVRVEAGAFSSLLPASTEPLASPPPTLLPPSKALAS